MKRNFGVAAEQVIKQAAVTVCCKDKRSVEPLLRAAYMVQPVAEGAAQGTHGLMQGVRDVVQDGPEFGHYPPFTHHFQGVWHIWGPGKEAHQGAPKTPPQSPHPKHHPLSVTAVRLCL